MARRVNTAVLVRLTQAMAAAHPDESDERVFERARKLLVSLSSVGLEVVFSSWIDDPMSATTGSDPEWDPFIEGMRQVLKQNEERHPWLP